MYDKLFRMAYWVAIIDLLVGMYVMLYTGILWQGAMWILLGIVCFCMYYWNERRNKKRKVDKND